MENRNWNQSIPLLGAALLAISPWHIQFSRVAFESNIGVSLSVFSALFFLYGLRKQVFLYFSALFLGLGLYAYQSEKVFFPLFVLVLVGIFWRQLRSIKLRILIGAILLGLLIALPMLVSIISDRTTLERAQNVSIFNGQSDDFKLNAQKLAYDHQANNITGLLFDNRRVLFAKQIIENYISHFDLNWLFIKGDIGRHHAPGMGLLYLVELPFLFIGIYSLLFGSYSVKTKLFLFTWLLIAPIPASLTTGVPHAVRAFHMVPVISILTAIGTITALEFILKFKIKVLNIRLSFLCISLYFLFFIFNFIYYLDQYFVQLPYFTSEDWQYGYQQTVRETNTLGKDYDKIVVSNNGYLDQSYVFYLFYLKFPPVEYQTQMNFINNSQADRKFGKYEFRPIDWINDKKLKRVLFIGMPEEFPKEYPKKVEIDFLDGKPAFDIVGT